MQLKYVLRLSNQDKITPTNPTTAITTGIRPEGTKIAMDITSIIKTGGNPKKKNVNKSVVEALPPNSLRGSLTRPSEVTFSSFDHNFCLGFFVPSITLFSFHRRTIGSKSSLSVQATAGSQVQAVS
jgi:hypothetical protein